MKNKKIKEKKKKILAVNLILILFFSLFSFIYLNTLTYSNGETAMKIGQLISSGLGFYSMYRIIKNIHSFLLAVIPSKEITAIAQMFGPTTEDAKILLQAESSFLYGELAATVIASITSATISMLIVENSGVSKSESKLPGNQYCSLCNWDNFTICLKERCEILGNCFYQPTPDKRKGICMPSTCEAGFPKIKKLKAIFLNRTKKLKEIKNENCPDSFGGCTIDANEVSWEVTGLNLSFETSFEAECRFTNQSLVPFYEMDLLSPDEIYMKTKHQIFIDLSKAAGFKRDNPYIIYIKCRGACEAVEELTSFDYNYIKFKIQPEPDWISPEIQIEPPNAVVPENQTYLTINLYLNKEGSCAYSDWHPKSNLSENFDLSQSCFDEMEKSEYMCHFGDKLSGDSFIIDSKCELADECKAYGFTFQGKCTKCWINVSLANSQMEIDWNELAETYEQVQDQLETEACSQIDTEEKAITCSFLNNNPELDLGLFEGLTNKLFTLKFRCANKDGIQTSPVIYPIITMPPFEIKVKSPQANLKTFEREIELLVLTQSKANQPWPTLCKYSLDKEVNWEAMRFIECEDCSSLNNLHEGMISNLSKGKHSLWIKCRDIFGLEISKKIEFEIIPAPLPKIIRIWVNNGYLYIETDIKANCKFGFENCNTNKSFTKVNDLIFSYYLIPNSIYWVKCIDLWQDNDWPSKCTIIKPFELPKIP